MHKGARWVTFDLDNTLIKNPYWRLHFRPWLEHQATVLDLNYRHLWEQFRREGQRRWQDGHWVESFDWPDIAASLALPPLPDPAVPDLDALRSLVIPGAEAALRHIQSIGLRLGLVTNGFLRFQLPYLTALGWDTLFDLLITPDQTGFAKPDQRMMDAVTPGLAHIGDRLSHDVLVAQRSNRLGILVGTPGFETDRLDPLGPSEVVPDFAIGTLMELPLLIESQVSLDPSDEP